MNNDEWSARFAKLQEKQSARNVTSEAALRRSLAEIWELLRNCPGEVATIFRETSEADLLAWTDPRRDSIAKGRLLWEPPENNFQMALAIGGQMRAIDAELAERPSFAQPPAGPNSYLCAEVGVFVIPRRDGKFLDHRTGPGRGFGRRGSPHHRILPHRIAGFEVRLVWVSQLSAGSLSASERALGAAMLPGMQLRNARELEPQWIAQSAHCPDEDELIRDQVAHCYDEAAFALVYPELSMPDSRRQLLAAALRARSQEMEPGEGPALVAAGSWHDQEPDGVRNVMRILDKTGVERMRYVKSSAFCRDGVKEGILVDHTIPVLVNTDFLATFAICLDFCERELLTPYNALDVDLIIVPSHGNAETMKSHEANAGDFHIQWGGQVFVVQHSEEIKDPLGYVLPPERKESNLTEDRAWSLRKVRFN